MIEHASSATAFGEEHLKLCCQVQKIFIASAELKNLLENVQIVTGEVKQFRSEKPVHLKDYVMHKWESQKNAMETQSKLPLSIDYALAQLTHDVSKKYSHGIRSKAIGLYGKVSSPEHILYQYIQLDLSDVLVNFTCCIEGHDVDLELYVQYVATTKLKLRSLRRKDGTYYKIGKLLYQPGRRIAESEDLLKPAGPDDLKELFQKMDVERNALVNAFLNYMEKYCSEEITGLLNGFSLLSLQKLQRQAKTEEQLWDFFEEEEDILCDFFYKDLSIRPTAWDGITYSQPTLGSPSQLRNEIFDHKLFMFKNYMGRKNPATREEWKTRDALTDLLSLPRDQTPKHMLPESSIIQS